MDPITQNWLDLQCGYLEQTVSAVVLLGAPGSNSYETMACWPAKKPEPPVLKTYAEKVLSKGIIEVDIHINRSGNGTVLVCPILIAGQCFGVIAVLIEGVEKDLQQRSAKALQWGCEWFSWLARERKLNREQDGRLLGFVEVLALALKHEEFYQCAKVIADDLLERSGCSRVCIGIVEAGSATVVALSGTQAGENVLAVAKPIQKAMDEAVDQSATIYIGENSEDLGLVTYAHRQLMVEHEVRSVCSIPMIYNEKVVAVINYESVTAQGFDKTTLRFTEQLALLLGPILVLKNQRGVSSLKDRFLNRARVKMLAGGVAALMLLLCFIPGQYSISAEVEVESDKKQMVLASQDGFIISADVRAGDLVERDQLLASLDDQDLRLEWQKWQGKKSQFMKSYNNALGSHDRTEINIYKAQLEQAKAQLDLVKNKLSRTRLLAPFAGVVVSGDLSQSLGSPVKRGDLLYEIAPAEQYRLLLKVDERDVVAMAVGHRGEAVLSSLPGLEIGFKVSKITPISVTGEGNNFFHVEASIEHADLSLFKPGMTGIAKVDAGSRAYMWIWFHRSVDWLRLLYWRF